MGEFLIHVPSVLPLCKGGPFYDIHQFVEIDVSCDERNQDFGMSSTYGREIMDTVVLVAPLRYAQ